MVPFIIPHTSLKVNYFKHPNLQAIISFDLARKSDLQNTNPQLLKAFHVVQTKTTKPFLDPK